MRRCASRPRRSWRRVAREGDRALVALARELDGVALAALEVPREAWREALDALAPPLRAAMERSTANLTAVHRAFRPAPQECSPEPGIRIGRRPDALGRGRVYAPGAARPIPAAC